LTAYLSDLRAQLRLFFARLEGAVSAAILRYLLQPGTRRLSRLIRAWCKARNSPATSAWSREIDFRHHQVPDAVDLVPCRALCGRAAPDDLAPRRRAKPIGWPLSKYVGFHTHICRPVGPKSRTDER
jgi:hypothetical protein